jgi:hypothetical protein
VHDAHPARLRSLDRRLVETGLAHPPVSDEEQRLARGSPCRRQGAVDGVEKPVPIEQG